MAEAVRCHRCGSEEVRLRHHDVADYSAVLIPRTGKITYMSRLSEFEQRYESDLPGYVRLECPSCKHAWHVLGEMTTTE